MAPLALSERSGGDAVLGVVADGSGGLWVTGRTESGGIVASSDALQRGAAGNFDAFVQHIGRDGSVLYSTYLGGTGEDYGNAIARDLAGNLYVVGGTISPDFPTTGAANHPTAPGGLNGFVTKLDPTGRQVIYSTYLGGDSTDVAYGVAADAGGNAHVVGSTQGFGFPYTWNRCLSYTTSQESSFYTKLNADGSTVAFSTCLDDSTARGVTLDGNGAAYVVGSAFAHFGPLVNAIKVSYPANASSQAFLAKFTSSSSNPLLVSTLLGGSASDWANGIGVSATGIYIAGAGYSTDYPGAPARQPHPRTLTLADGSTVTVTDSTAWIMKVRLDGLAVLGTTLIDGDGLDDEALSLQVDAGEVVHVTGWTDSTDFPVGADAPQQAFGGRVDAWYGRASMPNNTVGNPSSLTYLGRSDVDRARALTLDGSGGAWIGGESGSPDFQNVNARTTANTQAFVARFGQPVSPASATGSDVVLYARDAGTIAGNWQPVADNTAAGGTRLWNSDAGLAKIGTALANPATYFELTFDAQAGVPYHLWLRMKAENDSYQNDSVFVQFSDTVDGSGNPVWRLGTTSATVVSLEDCSGCGEQGWGWNDNGYNAAGQMVTFATTGPHTIRIQQREDGISIDQIVLSSGTWAASAPGANRNDTTIVPQTAGTSNQPPSISLTSPTNGATYTAPATLTVSGTATDPDGSIYRVDTYINGELTAGAQPANFSASWYNLPAGTYSVRVVAIDNEGAETEKSVTVTVNNSTTSNQPPTVTITSPASGTTIDQSSWPVIRASASDSDGSIAKVAFYANSTLLWTSTTSPYRVSWESMPEGTYTLTAVATDNNGASATSSPVTLTVVARPEGDLPFYWTDQDIGDVGAAGSAAYANGTFTVQGSGADVWGTADAFHYADVPTGATEAAAIVARVASVSSEASWVKAGVMMRASPDANAAQAFMLVSHAKGVCFQRRVSTGATTTSTCGTMSTAPRWVKLVRIGDVIGGYESADGVNWTLVGSDTFTEIRGTFAGLAVSSHVRGTLSTATFDHVWVMDGLGPNQPPTVSLTSPANGATFTAPATVPIGFDAFDDLRLVRVDLYANSTLIGSVPGNSEVTHYDFNWSNVAAGTYTLTAIAFDGEGSSTTSRPVTITVSGGAPSTQCSSVTLSQTSFYSGGPASTWRIDVTAPSATCTWTASIDQSWLVLNGVTGPTTVAGSGSGRVTLQTLDNRTGANRFGTFTIGGTAYTVTQEPY